MDGRKILGISCVCKLLVGRGRGKGEGKKLLLSKYVFRTMEKRFQAISDLFFEK